MLDKKIKVKVNDKEVEVNHDTSLEELAKIYQDDFEYPIILARVNNMLKNLTEVVSENSEIEFLDLKDRDANRVYLNGLIFLTILAIKELYGYDVCVNIRHSIDKGLYIEITKQINRESIKRILDKMKELSNADLRIVKCNVKRLEAINYFEKVGAHKKAGVLRYNTNSYVTLYKLANIYDFYFSEMPPSTKVIDRFDIEYLNNHGFILLYPSAYNPDKIKKYVHHPQLFDTFKENHEWAKIMKVSNVTDLNDMISRGIASSLIKIDETIQSNRLLEIAKDIYNHKDRVRIVLIAGPSSSGKTTTSLKLTNNLRGFGIEPKKISMDDYFVDREKTPKREDGSYDYECLEALEIELFNNNVSDLLAGKSIIGPRYNFIKGEKEFINHMELNKDEILIIEGIHALNPKILNNITRSRKYKIYISPTTGINIDEHNRISTSDNRMLRRIVRDNRTRNYTVEDTLEMWSRVREGEENYIFPFQDEANVTFNSALLYELAVLKIYVEPLLYSVKPESKYYEEARRLINMLRVFLPLPADGIPDDSLLREFIGGSYYNVD